MINCVIIEDEPLAQNGLLNLIRLYPSLTVLSVCDDVKDFIQFQKNNKDKKIDLLFLDIELPGINGIHFLRRNRPEIPVILTTAYNEFAIEGYELNVLDYLLKPIAKERFSQAVSKAQQYTDALRMRSSNTPEFIYIKSDKVLEKVLLNELILLEAMRNYVIYHCENQKLICYTSLKNAGQSLPAGQFVKIQKSFIINKNKVEKIEKGLVFIHNRQIAINRLNRTGIIGKLTAE